MQSLSLNETYYPMVIYVRLSVELSPLAAIDKWHTILSDLGFFSHQS